MIDPHSMHISVRRLMHGDVRYTITRWGRYGARRTIHYSPTVVRELIRTWLGPVYIRIAK